MLARTLLAVSCATAVAHATPLTDLASAEQATRDAAAAVVRKTYRPSRRRYDATFTSFYDDGAICVVQHFGPTGANGEDVGYYRSGKVKYRGAYKDGAMDGTWTWFNEDGTVHNTQVHGTT
jgi:hypothetical protein